MSTVTLSAFRAPGATDDNAALAAALAAGERVYLPAGDGTGPAGAYKLGVSPGSFGTPLAGNLVAGADIFGDGIGETVIVQSGDIALLANSLSSNTANNIRNISLRDLTIENQGYAGSNLVDIAGVSNFLAERVEFRAFPLDGLTISSSLFNGSGHERHNEDVTIRDCIFDGAGNATRRNGISIIDCTDWLIENCQFVDTSSSGNPGAIDVEPNANAFHRVRNGRVVGCRFRSVLGSAVNLLLQANTFFTVPITNISVEGCAIDNCAGGVGLVGYTGAGAATATKDYGVSFRGNLIRNTATPFLFSGALGVDFANNRMEDCDMSLLFSGGVNRKVRIVDNDFVRCGNVNGPAIVQDGSLTDVDVIGNRFLDCGRPDGAFGPIYFLRGSAADIDRLRLNLNRVESPTSPLRTTNFAIKVGGYSGTINTGNSQKTGNEFYNLASAMGADTIL
jgi:hypothetical protein